MLGRHSIEGYAVPKKAFISLGVTALELIGMIHHFESAIDTLNFRIDENERRKPKKATLDQKRDYESHGKKLSERRNSYIRLRREACLVLEDTFKIRITSGDIDPDEMLGG